MSNNINGSGAKKTGKTKEKEPVKTDSDAKDAANSNDNFTSSDNLQMTEEKIRMTVLTNICRMMIRRGYMDEKKYLSTREKRGKGVVEVPSVNDKFDNSLFAKYFENRNESSVYTIPLDRPYPDGRDAKDGKTNFDGSVLAVKLVPHTVKDITNNHNIDEFLKTYNNNHKILVFDGSNYKVYTASRKFKNTESFSRDYLMIDLMSHVFAPIGCEIVSSNDISHIIDPNLPEMYENDPLCRYYNGKRGQIIRIKRPSQNNSIEIAYRKITAPKDEFNIY